MSSTLATLGAAPHRVLFLPGAAQLVLVLAYWSAVLLEGKGVAPALADTDLPALAAHGWLMVYGTFPFFIFGFLFTAVPNWLERPPLERRDYLPVAIPMALGATLFYPGVYSTALAAGAVGLHLLGWAAALRVLWRLLNATRHLAPHQTIETPPSPGPMRVIQAVPAPATDRRHARVAFLACTLGAVGEASFLYWLLTEAPLAWRLAESLGIWGFLAPIFLAVCHRMIPWFTSRVVRDYAMYRPTVALWLMLAACLAHAALETTDLRAWLWLADGTLAVLTGWLALRWYDRGIHRVRLLAMLHYGFPWVVLACTLYAIDSLGLLMAAQWDLGLAPVHALGIGFFASMLLAMATRVSLGHSGRKLEADGLSWTAFWLLQATALARLLPDLFSALDRPTWIILSAASWLAAFVPWALRYGPFYWRARVDGKAG